MSKGIEYEQYARDKWQLMYRQMERGHLLWRREDFFLAPKDSRQLHWLETLSTWAKVQPLISFIHSLSELRKEYRSTVPVHPHFHKSLSFEVSGDLLFSILSLSDQGPTVYYASVLNSVVQQGPFLISDLNAPQPVIFFGCRTPLPEQSIHSEDKCEVRQNGTVCEVKATLPTDGGSLWRSINTPALVAADPLCFGLSWRGDAKLRFWKKIRDISFQENVTNEG